MLITNTTFKLPKRRLFTYTAPGNIINGKVIRNQIDYILIRKRFCNATKSVKTYPGADFSSEHNPVIAVVKVKLKKVQRKTHKNILDMNKLKSSEIKNQLRMKIQNKISIIRNENLKTNDINTKWKNIQCSILTESRQDLKHEQLKKKNGCQKNF